MTKTEFREALFTLEEMTLSTLQDGSEKENILIILNELLTESEVM